MLLRDTSTVLGGEGRDMRLVRWLGASVSLVFVQSCKCWTSAALALPAQCPGWLGACTLHWGKLLKLGRDGRGPLGSALL